MARASMIGDRFRLVTVSTRPGKQETFVSTVVLNEAESLEQLSAEATIAAATGWKTWPSSCNGWAAITCVKNHTTRTIYARKTGPMDDLT